LIKLLPSSTSSHFYCPASSSAARTSRKLRFSSFRFDPVVNRKQPISFRGACSSNCTT